ncbi:hypothetical protein DV737_g772, partial [Chaetothyriales sp. CBS 132003]
MSGNADTSHRFPTGPLQSAKHPVNPETVQVCSQQQYTNDFMDDHGAHHYHVHTCNPDINEDTLADEERDIYTIPPFISDSSPLSDLEKPLSRPAINQSGRSTKDDPYLVTWNGEDDTANPKNWNIGQKWAAVVCVSLFTFISPVSSSMSSPALPSIGRDLHVTNSTELTLTLSIFVAAYAIGPLFMGPLSEIYGRVIVLQLGNLFFLVWNTGCAWATSKGQLIAFRFLSGLGGSAPLAIGGGVLADCFTADDRGRAISIYSLMPLVGPAIGPVIGGFIAEYTTWRWCFWSVSLFTVCVQVIGLFFLRETWASTILGGKAAKLRKETGNDAWHTEWESPDRTLSTLLKTSLTRPFLLIGTQPIVQVLACYMAYLYGLLYLMLATFPALWETSYHESVGIGGLHFISLGLGFFVGTQIGAPLNDRIYRRLKQRNNGVGKPEFRVPLLLPGAILEPIGLFIYGWSAQYRVFWLVPDIGVFLFAAGTIMGFQALQTYIVDSYQRYAASAIAEEHRYQTSKPLGPDSESQKAWRKARGIDRSKQVKITKLSHMRYQHPDLQVVITFLRDFGLTVAKRRQKQNAGSAATAQITMCTTHARAPKRYLGGTFEVDSLAELDKITQVPGLTVSSSGIEELTTAPGGGNFLSATDPEGFPVNLICNQTAVTAPWQSQPEKLAVNFETDKPRQRVFQRFVPGPRPWTGTRGTLTSALPDILYVPVVASAAGSDESTVARQRKEVALFAHIDRGQELVDHHTMFLTTLSPGVGKHVHHSYFEVHDFDIQAPGHKWLKQRGYGSV